MHGTAATRNNVRLRSLPYPYRAMLAICSDLDEPPDRRTYWEIMRFLNTTLPTPIGRGVGLEVGNSIYFDMPADQFAYWTTDDAGRDMIRSLIRTGHIDCLHSYGDLAGTRKDAIRALEELDRYGCRLEVWTDHGKAPTNFGADIMRGRGDQLGHRAYHADLTTQQGIRYVWRGRVTSVIGQDVPGSLNGIWTPEHPLASTRTVVKEKLKSILGQMRHPKYQMHGCNQVMRKAYLRDGTRVYEFIRSNPHWGGVSAGETGMDIGQVLSRRMIQRLIHRQGVCILYTHLGKRRGTEVPLPGSAIGGFRRLAQASRDKRILVTTTRRLLGYSRAVREISFTTHEDVNGLRIDISSRARGKAHAGELVRADMSGLTFYVDSPEQTRVTLNNRDVLAVQRNGPDHTGRCSVSIPWPRLEFPE